MSNDGLDFFKSKDNDISAISQLDFDSVFDVANCFKKESDCSDFAHLIVDSAKDIFVKNDMRYTPMIYSGKSTYFTDFSFVIDCFCVWLNNKGVLKNNIERVKQKFFKHFDADYIKNCKFFLYVLETIGLVSQPPKKIYYIRTIIDHKEVSNTFGIELDCILISKTGLERLVTSSWVTENLDSIKVNEKRHYFAKNPNFDLSNCTMHVGHCTKHRKSLQEQGDKVFSYKDRK